MGEKKKICVVIGTRPEAIKMAPVVMALRAENWADVSVVGTGQHREMLRQVLDHFGIQVDIDLDVMTHNQTLPSLTARLLTELDNVVGKYKPDAILAQGDTTTVMTAALTAFYHRISFGHIEAGLRTGDLGNPFPEEANRVIAGSLATWHFAPTRSARDHLVNAGSDESSVVITGNTVIDALKWTIGTAPELPVIIDPGKRLVLVTAHRRENFGEPFLSICSALKDLAALYPDTTILYPVHPNPHVHEPAHRILGGIPNIVLSQPLSYPEFVAALKRSYIVISDSGGVQEEAPALGKPVLVLRHETERPEAVEEGVVKLVGTTRSGIVSEARKLLDDPIAWQAMARNISPYGDGRAAERIVTFIRDRFQMSS